MTDPVLVNVVTAVLWIAIAAWCAASKAKQERRAHVRRRLNGR